jgi:hypothetical protein
MCLYCGKNVNLDIQKVNVVDWTFNYLDAYEVEIQLFCSCPLCGKTVYAYKGKSHMIIQKLSNYLESHNDLIWDLGEPDEPEVKGKIIHREGYKIYLAKWTTKLKAGRKTFKISGELPVQNHHLRKMPIINP